MKKIAFGFVALIVLSIAAYQTWTLFYAMPSGNDPKLETVLLRKDMTFPQISKLLREKEILQSPRKFRFLTRILGSDKKLQPGEYEFQAPTPPYKIIRMLEQGKVKRYKVTFPEGTTVFDVIQILSQASLVDTKAFTKLLEDKNIQKELNVPGPSFEGFLFPDTYHFSKTEGERRILEAMVSRFFEEVTDQKLRRAKELGFNLLQWVTFASIVEKESSLPEEQPIVSSVFHNRLKINMRLQSDPTVIYGAEDYNGRIRYKHLRTPTPYNTYTKHGLPIGPIANPGGTALNAALNPKKTDFLYFVARANGTHVFAKTYAEHEKNVDYHIRGKR